MENSTFEFDGIQLVADNPPLVPVNIKVIESIENILDIKFPELDSDKFLFCFCFILKPLNQAGQGL